MPVVLTWQEIAIRLALTVIAGSIIGLNRQEFGRPAGMRTTLLVCLAASVSMIQANLLLAMSGRHSDSFVMLDLMRLPLGILSGMGFIGAGAILRKGNLIRGLTTAATLWFVTVLGLCFGGGQWELGLAALVLGISVLWCLKWLEQGIRQRMRAMLTIVTAAAGPREEQLKQILDEAKFQIESCEVTYRPGGEQRKLRLLVAWRSEPKIVQIPPIVEQLAKDPGVVSLSWKPQPGN